MIKKRTFRLAVWLCLLVFGFNTVAPTARVNSTSFSLPKRNNQDQLTFLPIVSHNYCTLKNFFDDFSDPMTGWPVGTDDYVTAEYLNGQYRVTTKQAGYLYLFEAPVCLFEASSVEVDFYWNKKTGSDIGLLFGITQNFDEYYFLDVNTDYKLLQVWHRDATGFTAVTPVFHNIPLTTNGAVANHLKVAKDSGSVAIYVNSYYIHLMSWGVIWPGSTNVGVALSAYSNVPVTDARFDNFRITGGSGTMSTSPGSASTLTSLQSHAEAEHLDSTTISDFNSPWSQMTP